MPNNIERFVNIFEKRMQYFYHAHITKEGCMVHKSSITYSLQFWNMTLSQKLSLIKTIKSAICLAFNSYLIKLINHSISVNRDLSFKKSMLKNYTTIYISFKILPGDYHIWSPSSIRGGCLSPCSSYITDLPLKID